MSSVEDKIPEGWVEKTLGEVVTFQRGFDLPKKDRKEGLFPLLVSNGQDGTHIEYKVKGPGIVTGRSGSLGNVFLSELDFWPLNTTLWIKNFHKNNVKYCYYFLKTFPFERYNSGSGVPTLNRNHIHPILVKIPKDLQEQKAIAQVLTAFDEKIENLRAQNQTLETLAQTIFKEWFLPSRQAGGKYQVGDELPEGWRVGKLSDTGAIVCGKTPSKSRNDFYGLEIPFIKIPDMHNQVFIINTSDNLSQLGANSQKNKTIPANSICVSCIATVGLVSLTVADSQTNQQINSIVPKNVILREFLYLSLSSMNKYLNDLGSGGTATLNVNTSTFSNIELVIPDENTLKSFHKIQAPIFDKILANLKQIQSLAKTRDTLLPKLMSGQLRVEGFKK